jgi:hypothetical protein
MKSVRSTGTRAPRWEEVHDISENDLREILAIYGPYGPGNEGFRLFADQLVEYCRKHWSNVRKRSARTARKEIAAQIRNIDRAAKWATWQQSGQSRGVGLRLLAPPGFNKFSSSAAVNLGGVVTPRFLTRVTGMSPIRQRPFGGSEAYEVATRAWSGAVVEDFPGEVMAGVLSAVSAVLADTEKALAKVEAKGGRPSFEVGQFLLMNLAGAYSRFGKRPAATRRGPFSRFTHKMVAAMGLPTGWIDHRLARAIKEWRLRDSRQ